VAVARSRLAARDRRGRSARALLCAGLSLAAALALAAPLVHAHLAAADAARGLCGEHHPESGSSEPSSDACSLCLAGAHAPAMRVPGAPSLALPSAPVDFAPDVREDAHGIARCLPGTPRAPPLPA
jgi:hypothetical protein